ncbi:hypothetical protein Ddc_19100 [Ditylenchus destructor]|nr:hypothetical protein Ddc_19100 [Ditylenchus destructor]
MDLNSRRSENQMIESISCFNECRTVEVMSNIATMDNGTMVEAFKYLNYSQLAKNSLVSKRYRDLIRSHRHKFALLYVDSLVMSNCRTNPSLIIVFDKHLSAQDYNEWVIRNRYSKQIPIEGQVAGKQSGQYDHRVYGLWANACYERSTNVFDAQTKLNHKHWPLFQHFVRLLMDPFILIQDIEFICQNDVLNLLVGAFNQGRDRLQCKKLKLNFEGNVQKLTGWMKSHVSCEEIQIHNYSLSSYHEELLDLLVTGAHCTSAIKIEYGIPSRIVVQLVQKFMDLKNSDECQMVESIRNNVMRQSGDGLKRDYADFMVKEERHEGYRSTVEYVRVFEFVNNDVGKKLQITEKKFGVGDERSDSFAMSLKNL